jgi:transcriptional regulator with XRE-family HTH domain
LHVAKKDILFVLALNIRKKRLELNLTQDQLSYEAGVSREYINKLETGNYNISIKSLEKIAVILDSKVYELLKE